MLHNVPLNETPVKIRRRPRYSDPADKPAATEITTQLGAEAEDADDQRVGPGNPPEKGKFKKGQSGNPKGRPKGSKGMKTLAREVFGAKQLVRTAHGEKRLTRMEIALLKLVEKAGKGDVRAIREMISLYIAANPEPTAAVETDSPEKMSAADAAALESLKAILAEEMAASAKQP